MADNETTINATCRSCDLEGEYQPGAFQVVTLETNLYILAHQYEFFCIKCYALSQCRIEQSVYDVLVNAGVRQEVRLFPEEVSEQWALRDKAVLTTNDLIEFLKALEVLQAVPSELVGP